MRTVLAALVVAARHTPRTRSAASTSAARASKMFNDATQVVLMREGTRTVLSMQNDYKGPLEDFAMVVPVPVVLHDGDVKTLPKRGVRARRVARLAAARRVLGAGSVSAADAYGEDDVGYGGGVGAALAAASATARSARTSGREDRGEVRRRRVQDRDPVGDGLGRARDVAARQQLQDSRRAPSRCCGRTSRAARSSSSRRSIRRRSQMVGRPRRAVAAALPLRQRGVLAADPARAWRTPTGKQDLIVNILAPEQALRGRELQERVHPDELRRQERGEGAVRRVLRGAVRRDDRGEPGRGRHRVRVDAKRGYHCDPCPALRRHDRPTWCTLGADVVGGDIAKRSFVLTRLHARYGKADMKDDLVFREAKPVDRRPRAVGQGRHRVRREAASDGENNFQARYAIRHWWTGPITCENPQRDVWGGPPDGS